MRIKRPSVIAKTRREEFGGLIFRERPPFLAQVNHAFADIYGMKETPSGAIMQKGVFSAPVDAHLALTTRCNMACRGCYSTQPDDPVYDIPLESARQIIDKLAELGCFSLSFGGGEPTMHPQLLNIAAYAREKQILPNMTTNGLTMTEDFAKRSIIFGNIHFSIHALKDVEHLYRNIRTYRKITGNAPGLNLLLTNETLPNLGEILTDARKAGVGKVLFLRYKTTAKNQSVSELGSNEDLKDFPKMLKELRGANRRMMLLFDCSLFELMAQSGFFNMKRYRFFDCNGCMGGNANIAIDVKGYYKPCSFWPNSFGHMSELTFDSWVNNPAQKAFRDMRKSKICLTCEYGAICRGGCRLLYADD